MKESKRYRDELLAALVPHVAARKRSGGDSGEPAGIRISDEKLAVAAEEYLVAGGDPVGLLALAAEASALYGRPGARKWANQVLEDAVESERYLRLWRHANQLHTLASFLEALPALFHPGDVRRPERRLKRTDPLAKWETFPGDPTWLDSPTVRRALALLWRSAERGDERYLKILRRFARAWTFTDRASQRAVADRRRVFEDGPFLEARQELAAHLKATWEEIAHRRPTSRSIQESLRVAIAEERIAPSWRLGNNPKTGKPADLDVAPLLWCALSRKKARGDAPWRATAEEALEAFYGKQERSGAVVDRIRVAASRRRNTRNGKG